MRFDQFGLRPTARRKPCCPQHTAYRRSVRRKHPVLYSTAGSRIRWRETDHSAGISGRCKFASTNPAARPSGMARSQFSPRISTRRPACFAWRNAILIRGDCHPCSQTTSAFVFPPQCQLQRRRIIVPVRQVDIPFPSRQCRNTGDQIARTGRAVRYRVPWRPSAATGPDTEWCETIYSNRITTLRPMCLPMSAQYCLRKPPRYICQR